MLRNSVTLIGNLGSDVELRTVGAEQTVARVSLASNRTYTNRAGDRVKDTHWFRLVAWGTQAERMAERLGRGAKVLVEGRLTTNSYERDGQRRETVEVVVTSFEQLARPSALFGEGGGEPSAAEPLAAIAG